MADLPSDSAIAEALSAAGSAHHEYEQTALKGVRDELWAGFYAAFVLGRLGDFTAASGLAALLEEVDAPSNWSQAAAEHVATTLRAQSDAMAPTVTDVSDRRRFEIEVDGAGAAPSWVQNTACTLRPQRRNKVSSMTTSIAARSASSRDTISHAKASPSRSVSQRCAEKNRQHVWNDTIAAIPVAASIPTTVRRAVCATARWPTA